MISTELKSITPRRPCMLVTFLLFLITIIISIKGVIARDERKEVIADLPTNADLDTYLSPLEEITDFCIQHKLYVDLNFEFGLFLINVNLRSILQKKRSSIPAKTRFRLEQLLLKNDVLADYFRYMVKKTDQNIAYEQNRRISGLFNNESTWIEHLPKFNVDLLRQTTIYTLEQLTKIYGNWENYYANVYDYDKYTPTPEDSDSCMRLLAENPSKAFNQKTLVNCQTSSQCKQAVNSGSEFGYGITHRILFLLLARFSRGCTLFSEKEDEYKVDMYCRRIYTEAQYITLNNFKLADLMMEQISLCSLFGHAQFIRRSWISKLLNCQTLEGCFKDHLGVNEQDRTLDKEPIEEGKLDHWTISNKFQGHLMGGKCSGHSSAVAAAMLSGAIRYIIENYY